MFAHKYKAFSIEHCATEYTIDDVFAAAKKSQRVFDAWYIERESKIVIDNSESWKVDFVVDCLNGKSVVPKDGILEIALEWGMDEIVSQLIVDYRSALAAIEEMRSLGLDSCHWVIEKCIQGIVHSGWEILVHDGDSFETFFYLVRHCVERGLDPDSINRAIVACWNGFGCLADLCWDFVAWPDLDKKQLTYLSSIGGRIGETAKDKLASNDSRAYESKIELLIKEKETLQQRLESVEKDAKLKLDEMQRQMMSEIAVLATAKDKAENELVQLKEEFANPDFLLPEADLDDDLPLELNEEIMWDGIFAGLEEGTNGKDVFTAGVVTASVSTRFAGKPSDMRDSTTSWYGAGNNTPYNAVMQFDMRGKAVSLEAYVIQTYCGGPNSHHLKTWVVEGSNDGFEWAIVDEQTNTIDLNGPSLTYICHLDQTSQPFEFIRIRQTGPSHFGQWYFAIQKIELHGSIS